MKLVRSLTAPNTVHVPDCAVRGSRVVPWLYATPYTLAEIADQTRAIPWLHLCGRCLHGVCHCGRCEVTA